MLDKLPLLESGAIVDYGDGCSGDGFFGCLT